MLLINNKCLSFISSSLPECISDNDCTKTNKNKCNLNVCECNAGSVPYQDMCKACESNQIVDNGACKDCSPGMNPTLDRLMCMDCEDDEISPDGTMCMMCTISGYVPNICCPDGVVVSFLTGYLFT